MKIKRFVAKDMRSALNQVKIELGTDAVIMSNTKTSEGIEIVAAIDEAPAKQVSEAKASNIISPEKKASLFNKLKAYNGTDNDTDNGRDVRGGRDENRRQSSQVSHKSDNSVEAIQVSDSLKSLLTRNHNSTQADNVAAPSRNMSQSHSHANRHPVNDALSLDSFDQPHKKSRTKKTSANNASANHTELAAMKREMAEMKKMMQFQMSGLMWQELARSEPIRAFLVDRFEKMGIANEVADQIASFVPDDASQSEAWDIAIDLLAGQINVTNNDIMRRGGIVALVGPTGVGKTTTVAKLAAHFARRHGADSVAVVTTDTYRIGASEQLQTYAKIIGCACRVVNEEAALSEVLYQLRNRKLILIDTAGVGQRDIRLAKQLEHLMQTSKAKIRSYLVMQATSQRRVLNETIEQFKKVKLNGCIFTKIDESMSLGEIISVAIQNSLPIGYLTDGQRVPEDIKSATPRFLVEKATGLMNERDFSLPYWFTDNVREPIYK